jgi:hypothetical protein
MVPFATIYYSRLPQELALDCCALNIMVKLRVTIFRQHHKYMDHIVNIAFTAPGRIE